MVPSPTCSGRGTAATSNTSSAFVRWASTASAATTFATDLVAAFRLLADQPPQVGSSTLRVASSEGPAVVDVPCDPAAHPLILDGQGKVESVNAGALPALAITDQR